MIIDKNITPENSPEISPQEKGTSLQKYFSRMDFSEKNDFSGGSQKRSGLKLAFWTWAAAAVDHLIIMGLSCSFLLIGTLILQTSVKTLITYQELGLSLILLYLIISITYFVLLRVFLGATWGEYSCSLRLGQPTERAQNSYSTRIVLRTLLIGFSGVIILPLLSLIFKKDLAGQLSGVSIYSLK
jgi:hypothetical protein